MNNQLLTNYQECANRIADMVVPAEFLLDSKPANYPWGFYEGKN